MVVPDCTVDQLIADIESTDESTQTYAVYEDHEGSPNMDSEKTGEDVLVTGDWLIVTAEDGETTAEYDIAVGSNVTEIEEVEVAPNIMSIDNVGEEITVTDPTTAGELKAQIQSTDGSTQTYTLHENDGDSPATAEIADATELNTTDWLTVESENQSQVSNLQITVTVPD